MQNIFLIGMPSSGKTTLGKELSKHIRYRFIDTDYLITKEQGMSVSQIFETKGEPFFRECEARVLRSIRPNSKLIVSTGGGMPCFHENMDYIKKNGVSVFLNVPIEMLASRMLKNTLRDRPHFKDDDDTTILTNLKQKIEIRLPIYTQANHTLNVPISVKDIINAIQQQLTI